MARVESPPVLPDANLVRNLAVLERDGKQYQAFSSKNLTPTTFSFSEGEANLLVRILRVIQRAFKSLAYGSYSLAEAAKTIESLSNRSQVEILNALAEEDRPNEALDRVITQIDRLIARLNRKIDASAPNSDVRNAYVAGREALNRARDNFDGFRAPVAPSTTPPVVALPLEYSVPATESAVEGFVEFREQFLAISPRDGSAPMRQINAFFARDLQMRAPSSATELFETAISAVEVTFSTVDHGTVRQLAERTINPNGSLQFDEYSAFFAECVTRVEDVSRKQFFADSLRQVPGEGYRTPGEAAFRARMADRLDALPASNHAELHAAIREEIEVTFPDVAADVLRRHERRLRPNTIPMRDQYHIVFAHLAEARNARMGSAREKFLRSLEGQNFVSRMTLEDQELCERIAREIEINRMLAPEEYHRMIEDAIRAHIPAFADELFASPALTEIDRSEMPKMADYKGVFAIVFKLSRPDRVAPPRSAHEEACPFPPAPPERAVVVDTPEVRPAAERLRAATQGRAEARAAADEQRFEEEQSTKAAATGSAAPLDLNDPVVVMARQMASYAMRLQHEGRHS